jgi:hypothetical protein
MFRKKKNSKRMDFKLKGYKDFINEDKFKKYLNETWRGNGINVFDLDDTLITSSAQIHVYDPIKKKEYHLTPSEYNTFKIEKQHELDFSDFGKIEIMRKGILINWVFTILKKTMTVNKAVGIITARSDANMIRTFFLEQGIDINPDFIFAVGGPGKGSIAERKKEAFKKLIEMGFKRFQYFDDDKRNIELVKTLEDEFSDISVKTKLIRQEWIPDLKKELKQFKE